MKSPPLMLHTVLILDVSHVSFYQVTYLETMDFLIKADS